MRTLLTECAGGIGASAAAPTIHRNTQFAQTVIPPHLTQHWAKKTGGEPTGFRVGNSYDTRVTEAWVSLLIGNSISILNGDLVLAIAAPRLTP